MNKLICCGTEAIWVENVPGKGYNYCRECKNEVLTPLSVEEVTVTANDTGFFGIDPPAYENWTHGVVIGGTGGTLGDIGGVCQSKVYPMQLTHFRIIYAGEYAPNFMSKKEINQYLKQMYSPQRLAYLFLKEGHDD